MTIVLETRKLNKIYRRGKDVNQHVLKDIDLQIRQGEFLCIMGPSGCGKSTLLHHISGMDRASSGNVLFKYEDFSRISDHELAAIRLEKMGFVFQHNNLLNNMNMIDNIVFPAYVRKKEAREAINERAFSLMKKMGIDHLAEKPITEVSGGQLQRAAICRALINRPSVILGDEPTGALDSKASADVMKILMDENLSGMTIILVTHDASVAARTQRVILMRDGAIAGQCQLGKWTGDETELESRESALYRWLKS